MTRETVGDWVLRGMMALCVAIPVAGMYGAYCESRTPTFELHKNQWTCTATVRVGVKIHHNECVQWTRTTTRAQGGEE